jgi:hypothetical protein
VAGDLISSAVGDASTKMRYADFERALTGKLNLLNIGSTGLSNVRNAALSNQGQRNQFNLGTAGLDYQNILLQQNQSNQESSMWSDILSGGISAAGNIYGLNTLKDIWGSSPNSVSGSSGMGSITNSGYGDLTKGFDWTELLKL